MGTIKDIVDLAKDLESRAKDRHDMEVIHKIQSMAFSLQSQHADTLERAISLMQENAELKRKLAESQSEEIRIHKMIEFRRGSRTGSKWIAFCPKCHMPAGEQETGSGVLVYCTGRCGWSVHPGLSIDIIIEQIEA